MLAAYSVVINDWQELTPNKRGHNIGAILVAPGGNVVHWARNCSTILSNATQHAELRLIIGYLNSSRKGYLTNHTVYSTLEPCAQCSGMMIMAGVERVVYGQADPFFGKAMERLALDSRGQSNPPGYRPYPRVVFSEQSKTPYTSLLNQEFISSGETIIAYLHNKASKQIFQAAAEKLRRYQVKFVENAPVLEQVQAMVIRAKPGVPAINIHP